MCKNKLFKLLPVFMAVLLIGTAVIGASWHVETVWNTNPLVTSSNLDTIINGVADTLQTNILSINRSAKGPAMISIQNCFILDELNNMDTVFLYTLGTDKDDAAWNSVYWEQIDVDTCLNGVDFDTSITVYSRPDSITLNLYKRYMSKIKQGGATATDSLRYYQYWKITWED